MAKTPESQDPRQNRPVDALEEEVERYRRATEAALQQLDWCIDHLHDGGKRQIARALASNHSQIRRQLLKRSE